MLYFFFCLKYIFKDNIPSRPKPVQSQKNNIRTTFTKHCSSVTFLTLNRFLRAGSYVITVFIVLYLISLKYSFRTGLL